MTIEEIKDKLEFEKIINRVKHYLYSDLSVDEIDNLAFITNQKELAIELSKVDQMLKLINVEGEIDLSGLSDIRYLLKKIKIEGNFISPDELLKVLLFLEVSRKTKSYFDQRRREYGDEKSELFSISEELFFDKILEHNISITVDESGFIKDTASSELRKLRSSLLSKEERLRKTLSGILKKYSEREFSQDEIITQRDGRFVIPVKVENKRSVPGIIHSASASGATVFVEPGETIEINNEITEIRFKINREIQRILIELCSQISKFIPELELNCTLLSEIDSLQARAKYANEINAVFPKLTEDTLILKDAYHPVLLQNHKRSDVIPLDIILGEKYFTIVITGPNAGGKTVSLKTVGLLQLMLQSGLLVPVSDDSEFRLFDKIFVNIGDEQSLDNDLSTFSSHLKSLKDVIDNADDSSLILIDEICSGTDPVLGSALSSSILKFLTEKKSFTIVTTHIGDLKKFAYSTEGIENASLEFDHNTLSPNYRFVTGVPGQSFTFEIAAKFNYPEEIMTFARELTDDSDSKLEDLIKELNENKQKYEELKNKNILENSRLNGLIKMYESKSTELEKNKRVLINSAKLEAARLVSDAKKLIEKTIKEIRENKADVKEIKSDFVEKSNELTEVIEESEYTEDPGEITIGDMVKLKDSGSVGEVIKTDKENVSVNLNGLLLKVRTNKIVKVKSGEVKKESVSTPSVEVNTAEIYTELDLRGKYPEEAEHLIEKFLYDSQVNGLNVVSIIHGKGTGKLREEVKRVLKQNSLVKESRYGNWNEGDTGVTIVKI